MRVRSLLLILLLAIMVGFVALNWAAFTAPTPLNLVFTSWNAPLGLVVLGLLAAVVLLFAVYMVTWQGTILVETRRQAKELQQQRALADQAEASRFTELRVVLLDQVKQLSDRMESLEQAMRTEVRESGNTLAATLAEMDDRLVRGAARP